MLTLVEVRTAQGTLLSLPLEDVSSGIIVEDIEGLEPVKATLVSSSFASQDGSQYHSSRREARNILVKLKLEPDYISESVRDLRKLLYGFFMPKSVVFLRFHMSDGLVVDISGRVEDFVSPHFTSEPKVSIPIVCFDPDFKAIDPVVMSGSTVSDSTETLIQYNGTIETGFLFSLSVDRPASGFTIYNRRPDDSTDTLDFDGAIGVGNVINISTVTGSKSVTRINAGGSSSLLYAMTPQSSWIELFPGANYIRVYIPGAPMPYTITYTPRYGGL